MPTIAAGTSRLALAVKRASKDQQRYDHRAAPTHPWKRPLKTRRRRALQRPLLGGGWTGGRTAAIFWLALR